MANHDIENEKMLSELKRGIPGATKLFANTLQTFGSSPIQTLMKNAYLLSSMADLKNTLVDPSVEADPNATNGNKNVFNDDKNNDGIDRYLSIFVVRAKNGNGDDIVINEEQMYKFVKEEKFLDHLKRFLPDEEYMKVWNHATRCSNGKLSTGGHTYGTAVVYSKIWLNFIDWSCNVVGRLRFSKEALNKICQQTRNRLEPMLGMLANKQGRVIGLRNFKNDHTRLTSKDVKTKLDQVMIECRHKKLTDMRKRQRSEPEHQVDSIRSSTKKFILLGVPISRDEVSKTKSEQLIETNSVLNICAKELYKDDEHYKHIRWDGSLDEYTMRRTWEIACLGMDENVELTTCSFKQQHSINLDKTVPCLQNSKDKVIHEHFTGNHNQDIFLKSDR